MLTCSPVRVTLTNLQTNLRGFTLIELMVALGVMAILLVIAAPSFRDAIMNMRMSAQANDLMADLALARSEAAKRGLPVMLCPSPGPAHSTCAGTDWTIGWAVFVDADNDGRWGNNAAEQPIKSRQAVTTGNTITTTNVPTAAPGTTAYLPYRPTGVVSASAATSPAFTMCDGRTTPNRGRQVTISPTGRALVTRITC